MILHPDTIFSFTPLFLQPISLISESLLVLVYLGYDSVLVSGSLHVTHSYYHCSRLSDWLTQAL
jgi:hypothetical protein